jgi:hypothetical protein
MNQGMVGNPAMDLRGVGRKTAANIERHSNSD